MSQLAQQPCEASRSDAPPVSEQEIKTLQREIPEWQLIERDGIRQLKRVFVFRNFKQALAFTNQVGDLAEQAGHHPALLTEWGKVTVFWWTHAINGLHKNDFILAARTDALLTQAP